MNKASYEPMVANQVHTTTDYFLFKPILGNRTKNLLHLKRLKESIADNYLFTVIIVNERYEIIDGQHRFDAIKELGLPLHYIICKGYGIREVQLLNANSKNWNAEDYIDGYCDMGFQNYILFREYKNKYQFGYNECMVLLTGQKDTKSFYEGKLKINYLQEAERRGDLILNIEPFYKGFRRRAFVLCINTLLNNDNFSFTEFIAKLRLQPTSLIDCPTVNQYMSLIEEIYNYKRRDKINLRYS
jgi:hypothetical protein